MVAFAELSDIIKKRLDDDLEIKSVETEMPTLEEAVREAAATLGIPVYHLDYEILLRKTSFLGIGENICKIRAYERADIKRKKREAEAAMAAAAAVAEEVADMELVEDLDGEIFVKRLAAGVQVKVTPPVGEGERVRLEDAKKALAKAKITDYDEKALRNIIAKQAGEYARVGDYTNNPANNAAMSVDISEDEMRAFLFVSPPGPDGADITLADIKQILNTHGIVFGINDEFLKAFSDKPIYREKICVAKGIPAVNGMNSFMQYLFETDQSRIKLKESADGRVDFKEMNIIQNVKKDEMLAIWNPAEDGKNGQTVMGRILMTQPGKDGTFDLGNNVHLGDDRQTILASIDGQVLLINGKISVEPVYEVAGDVGLKTGNIEFVGNVYVKGDVLEGFKVKATGNIEVNGTVNKATLDAEGDIIVKQGIYGKEGTLVRSGRSVWAKFIENTAVKSGNIVVVSDGIINSYVDAAKKILCSGRYANIVGGRLRAAEEINCKTLGASGGSTETVCEVAIDPQSKAEMEALAQERETTANEYDDVVLNARTLENQRTQKGSLPDDKEEYFTELVTKKGALAEKIRGIDENLAALQERVNSLATIGRVSASDRVYPGVVICIREEKEKVRSEYKAVSFVLEQGLIRTTRYMEAEDVPGKPERGKK